MNVDVSYSTEISDDAAVQDALKSLLDTQLDKDGAGDNYPARTVAAMMKFGTEGLKQKIRGVRSSDAVKAMREAEKCIKECDDICDGVCK